MWEIVTIWPQAQTVGFGHIRIAEVEALEQAGYDGAPVLENDKPVAFGSTQLLRRVASDGVPLATNTPGLWSEPMRSEPRIDELLRFTLNQPAAIVLASDGTSPGFFTLSDLNRHPVRAALYPLFAELEAELAVLVGQSFEDPWEWLELVPKDRRAALVGYWKMSERDDVDIGPIAGAMLSELGGVVAKHEPLRSTLGFESRRQWEEAFNGLNEQRHSIMHPVRPLVSNLDDLAKVVERLDKLLNLIGRVTSATQQPEAAS